MGYHIKVVGQDHMSYQKTRHSHLEGHDGSYEARFVELLQSTAHKRQAYAPFKRAFDVIVCSMALIPISILMSLIALAIWWEDGGPIFFVQERTGYKGQRFRIVKFRTMMADAEVRKQELLHLNELKWPDFKIRNDPRVTKVGRFLRRTSLDELPQIVNILSGEMSLVGPRPTSFPAETYLPWQKARLEAVPGLTGLWQISGRSDIDFEERAYLDIQYISEQSFALDILILLRTFYSVSKQDGAY